MIQCHGIGVIDPDEWVAPDPQAHIPIPTLVHMTKIINLRLARKRAARLLDGQRAAERRAQYGMPKVKRALVKALDEKVQRNLDSHRIGNGEGR